MNYHFQVYDFSFVVSAVFK